MSSRPAKRKLGTKRSRNESSANKKEQAVEEQQQLSYCRRLLHQCRKDLHKNAKVCKNFECQKLIRKLKAAKPTDDNDKEQNDQQGDHNSDRKLREWRELSLDDVLSECFRRLGVLDLLELEEKSNDGKGVKKKPAHQKGAKKENADDSGDTSTASAQRQVMLERVLEHKRMREAIERWSEQVTEYRRWCSRNSVSYDDVDVDESSSDEEDGPSDMYKQQQRQQSGKGRKKPKKRSSTKAEALSRQKEEEAAFVDASRSLFATLGDEAQPDEDDDQAPKAKKNRAGQKARRAKAQAMEARRQGRTVDHSTNWREPKKHHGPRQGGGDRQGEQYERGSGGEQQKQPNKAPENEELHPSWEARKTQKPSIVAFQGKKITFD